MVGEFFLQIDIDFPIIAGISSLSEDLLRFDFLPDVFAFLVAHHNPLVLLLPLHYIHIDSLPDIHQMRAHEDSPSRRL